MNSFAKKGVLVLLSVLLIISAVFAVKHRASASSCGDSATAYMVLEQSTRSVLKWKNPDKRLPMASTTKIATAITVIENCEDLQDVISVPDCAEGVEGSSIYLRRGEKIRIIDLLYGLMLQSGNDCAVALAMHVGGSVSGFAEMMNAVAKKAGAVNTNFVNPHGLHDDEHYTTARDLALISAYALDNEVFSKIVATKSYSCPWDGKDIDRIITNKNKILSTYDGGDGVKTGYTKRAGRCLVSSATRNGMQIVAVVLNCSPMFEECRKLMDEAFESYSSLFVNDIINDRLFAAVCGGKNDSVELGVLPTHKLFAKYTDLQSLKIVTEGVSEMKAPVKIGTENGKIKIFAQNKLLFCEKLYTINDVAAKSAVDALDGELYNGLAL